MLRHHRGFLECAQWVADSGVGTTNHLCLELMSEATGAKYTLAAWYKSTVATHFFLFYRNSAGSGQCRN